jgi:hypothetical protein
MLQTRVKAQTSDFDEILKLADSIADLALRHPNIIEAESACTIARELLILRRVQSGSVGIKSSDESL